MISSKAIVHSNVTLGKNIVIEDYCIIGSADKSSSETIIGDNAIIRAGTIIYPGNTIGDNFQTGNKANIRENNIIGNNVSIGTLTVVEHSIKIENNVRIHSQAFIPEYTHIKQGAWIGPNVVFTNAKYPLHPDTKNNLLGPIIYENAKIGANCTILPGVKIGENALVGAGSVVTKDIQSFSVVAGNPATFIKKVEY